MSVTASAIPWKRMEYDLIPPERLVRCVRKPLVLRISLWPDLTSTQGWKAKMECCVLKERGNWDEKRRLHAGLCEQNWMINLLIYSPTSPFSSVTDWLTDWLIYTHSLTHSLTFLLTHSLIRILIHSFTHSHIHLLIYSLTCSLKYSLAHSHTHSPTQSYSTIHHSSILLILSLTNPLIH